MAENHTAGPLRVRIVAMPIPGELEEFDLSRFRVGNTYELPSQLASLLIIAGYAEVVAAPSDRAEAADYDYGYFRKRKPNR